jgi:hypothetical protein
MTRTSKRALPIVTLTEGQGISYGAPSLRAEGPYPKGLRSLRGLQLRAHRTEATVEHAVEFALMPSGGALVLVCLRSSLSESQCVAAFCYQRWRGRSRGPKPDPPPPSPKTRQGFTSDLTASSKFLSDAVQFHTYDCQRLVQCFWGNPPPR